jgi:hypothetical protein
MRTQKSPRRRSRTRRTRLAARWSALLAAVLLALAGPASAATWAAVTSPNLTQFDNVLWGVDALSPTSAWAVGRADTGTLPIRRPVIERWNGAAWSISPSPLPSGGGELRDVDATSAGNNGQAWSVVDSPDTASFENHLLAVDGVSPNDLWAVGHTRNGDYSVSAPLILHWDGSAWSVVPSPTANDGTLEGVVALASDDVWAVGSMFSTALLWHVPFALHWDGRSWRSVAVPSPTPQGGRLFGVAALSPSKVYAVGQAPGVPSLVLRWNGSGWARETTPATGTVWDAAASGPGTVWAVGQRGNPNVGVGRTFTLRTGNG